MCRPLGPHVVAGSLVLLQPLEVFSLEEVDRLDLDVAEERHCDMDPILALAVVGVSLYLEEAGASSMGHRNAEVAVVSSLDMGHRRNGVVVGMRYHSYRRFEAAEDHAVRNRHSVHEEAVFALGHLQGVVDLHVHHICQLASICLQSHIRSVDPHLLDLLQVQVALCALHVVSAYRTRANLPSSANPLAVPAVEGS